MYQLEARSYPRSQMLLLVSLTGLVGLATSYGLLHGGVESMGLRYPLAVGCAYAAFLVLLWLWLRTQASDYLDFPQPGGGSSSGGDPAPFSGGGGHSGGGGASGSFQMDTSLPSPSMPDINVPGADAVGDVVGAADEGAIPLVITVLVAAIAAVLLFSTLYIVYLAPALFAEMVVDGILAASLYRRLRHLETRHWVESAVRRTWMPFAITAISLGLLGFALQAYAPQAHTLAQAMQHYRASHK